MPFEDAMGSVQRWIVSVEALAALGAELALKQSGAAAPPEIVAALRKVSESAGLGDLDDLAPQQQAVLAGTARMYIRQAAELLDNPERTAGWTFTDPIILDGWGRGSMMVPPLIAAGAPEIGNVDNFLDVGTGVGLLAVAAANVWPDATIVGVDRWEPSLERARANVAQAWLGDRIELRNQDVAAVDDVDRYDCVWVPSFFLTEDVITRALPRLLQATRPGGWIVFGRFDVPPDPLAEATASLRTIRAGGCDLDQKRSVELLEDANWTSVHVAPRTGPMPLEFVLGQKPVQ